MVKTFRVWLVKVQHDKGHENRQRNGDGDDQRAGQVPQKQQNDRRREQRAMEGLLDEVLDRLPDIDRLVEGDAQPHARRNADHFGDRLPQGIDDFHRVRNRLLVHPQVDGAFAVRADHVGLNVRRVAEHADITHAHRVTPLVDFHDDVVDGLHRLELRVGEHVVVEVPGFDVARRQNQVGGLHGA
jgi:hypothetical protein